jgi:transposase InsO family protein
MHPLEELEAVASTVAGCAVLGLSRATVYRSRMARFCGPLPPRVAGVQPNALSDAERSEILNVLNCEEFLDKSPSQVWAVLLDRGRYVGSVSTLYRVLREGGLVRERRAQATHPARVRPELVADGPNQVWSWDITKLRGPCRGVYFDAYVILDIYSRKAIHWEVHTTENGELAKDFLDNSVAVNGGSRPGTIHSDNGTSMTSKNVAALLSDLHIERSLSRPHVSNDNPYSESLFKTVKYCPAFPGNFASIYDARVFMNAFFEYYNTEHRHSGIGLYTPGSVHDGTWENVRVGRQRVLDQAYGEFPDRFRKGRPVAPALPVRAWINQTPSKIES